MTSDEERKLPLSFYGQSYLGRPVNVSVMGETALGGPAGGPAAVAAGGAGPTAPAEGAPPTPGGVPAGGPNMSALQGLNYAQKGLEASSLVEKGVQGIGAGPWSVPSYASDPILSSLGAYDPAAPAGYGTVLESNVGPMFAEPGATSIIPGAGTGAAGAIPGAAATAAGAIGTGLGAGALEGWAWGQLPIDKKTRTNLDYAGMAFPLTSLPMLASDLISGKLFGAPPAMNFPQATWGSITEQVHANLPEPLQVPSMATPEQRQAIEAVNSKIEGLRTGYAKDSDLPTYLQGKQSAESWTNTMNTIKDNLQQEFQELSDSYPKAQEMMMQSYQDFLGKNSNVIPKGAPSGLIEELGTPLGKLSEALQKGDYAAAEAAIKGYPTDPSATLARYAPQIEAAKELPTGFYLGDDPTKKKQLDT